MYSDLVLLTNAICLEVFSGQAGPYGGVCWLSTSLLKVTSPSVESGALLIAPPVQHGAHSINSSSTASCVCSPPPPPLHWTVCQMAYFLVMLELWEELSRYTSAAAREAKAYMLRTGWK